MSGKSRIRSTGGPSDAAGCAGCSLAALGAATAALVWAPHAAVSVHGGFEGESHDPAVLFIDLPLVLLGGALLPLLVWAPAHRWLGRPWLAALAAVAVLGLGEWALVEWWTPRRPPSPGDGPGV
ncbi:hypothetical protein [Streptomyces sp. NPDC053560]|uniref:hypothetical protein n=1 Tax=Streptomyces sp. NPDC053560 TaxID=3365711 RepID=UPI0037D60053